MSAPGRTPALVPEPSKGEGTPVSTATDPRHDTRPDAALWRTVAARVAPPMPPAVALRSPLQQRRRRGFDSTRDDGRETLKLVRDDGVLRWMWEAPPAEQRGSRRAWRTMRSDDHDVVERLEYPPLGRNQITTALQNLDLELNPVRGLRRWAGVPAGLPPGTAADDPAADPWQPVSAAELAALKGRVLLLVHGTFSKGRMYDAELGATPAGRTLLTRLTAAGQPYAAVLNFEHATLSVAPWLNALALRDALAPLAEAGQARLDVVCHSRGGLVACWAMKIAPSLPVDQVVCVGSPLMGTSLAAPNRLRDALDLLANMADAVSQVAAGTALAFPPALPLAQGAAGLAKALGRVLHLGATLPLADAVVGLVPGLMAQSRVENNLELAQLFPLPGAVRMAGVGGTFRPDESKQPLWKFWNRFSHLGDQLKYAGADLIFRQANDLVVDRASMNQLGGPHALIPAADWLDLGERPHTHHCSYFRDTDVLAFLEQRLS